MFVKNAVIAPTASIDSYDPQRIEFLLNQKGFGMVLVQEPLPLHIEQALQGMSDRELISLNSDFQRATQARNLGKKPIRTLLCELAERNEERLRRNHYQSRKVIGNVFNEQTRLPTHVDECAERDVLVHQHIWGPSFDILQLTEETSVRVIEVRDDFVIDMRDLTPLLAEGKAHYLQVAPGTSAYFNGHGPHRTSRMPGVKLRQLNTPSVGF